MEVAFSLARADNGAIGYHGKLPWRLPNDLKRFKELSIGKPIIMGRASFERDLERKPLPKRLNIVCSRDPRFIANGVTVAHTIESALQIARAAAKAAGIDEIQVIGGAEVFRAAMPYATRIYLTEVHASPEADTYLDAFDPLQWAEAFREEHGADERHSYPYTFLTLDRRSKFLPIP